MVGDGYGQTVIMRSPSLFVVIVPGVDMVEMLAKSFDMVNLGSIGSSSSSSSSSTSNDTHRDYGIVKLALEWIEATWPQELRVLTGDRDRDVTSQIVVVFDFLGGAIPFFPHLFTCYCSSILSIVFHSLFISSDATNGAFHKVQSALNTRELQKFNQSESDRQQGIPLPPLCLEKGREISEAAAKYIMR